MGGCNRPPIFLLQNNIMKTPEEILLSAGESVEYARQYVEHQADIIRLEAAERSAKVISSLITAMVLGVIGFLVVVMLSMAAGFWLTAALDSAPQAFLIIAAAYVMVGAMLYFFRRSIITNPSLDFVLDAFFNDDDKEHNQTKK